MLGQTSTVLYSFKTLCTYTAVPQPQQKQLFQPQAHSGSENPLDNAGALAEEDRDDEFPPDLILTGADGRPRLRSSLILSVSWGVDDDDMLGVLSGLKLQLR